MDNLLYPSEGLSTIELPKISLAKLLKNDETEAQAVFDICCRTGFFYLDLMDHAKGEKLWESACLAREIGQNVMSTVPLEEKNKFLKRPGTLDRGFLRILRYPGLKENQAPFKEPRVLPHRDGVSIAMLFTWVYGLQIPEEHPKMIVPGVEAEDSWRWVKPMHGHTIINLGNAIRLLTNRKLASGKHRVVHAVGNQAKTDRVSVLVSVRPGDNTPMKAFESPMIPQAADRKDKIIETAIEWGDRHVKNFIKKMDFKETQ
ncbi:MAG: hypothetical protein Q9157_005101 [Trypethelium eluteriae]